MVDNVTTFQLPNLDNLIHEIEEDFAEFEASINPAKTTDRYGRSRYVNLPIPEATLDAAETHIINRLTPAKNPTQYIRMAVEIYRMLIDKRRAHVDSDEFIAMHEENKARQQEQFQQRMRWLDQYVKNFNNQLEVYLGEGDRDSIIKFIQDELEFIDNEPPEWKRRIIRRIQTSPNLEAALAVAGSAVSKPIECWKQLGLWK